MAYDDKDINSNVNIDEHIETDNDNIAYKDMLEEDYRILDYYKDNIQEYIDKIKDLVSKGK